MFGVQKPITATGRRVHRTTFGLRPVQHKAAIGVMSVTVMSVTTDPRYYGPYPSQLLIPRPPPDSCGSWAAGRPVKGGTRRGETQATALACRIICLRPPQPGVTFLGRVQGRNLPGQVVIPGRRSQLVDAHRHNQPRGYMPPWRSGRPKLLPMVHGCVTSDFEVGRGDAETGRDRQW
jgi:hypothetical protein